MNLILQAIKSLFRKVEASRTHWDTRQPVTKKITFDGNMEGKETVPIDEWSSLVKVSEEVPTVDDVIGATIAYYNEGDTFSETVVADTIGEAFPNAYMIGDEGTVCLVFADVAVEGVPPITKGVWVVLEADENGTPMYYPTSFEYTVTTGELKKLDEKYLPDSVATVEQVEAVQAMADNASMNGVVTYECTATSSGCELHISKAEYDRLTNPCLISCLTNFRTSAGTTSTLNVIVDNGSSYKMYVAHKCGVKYIAYPIEENDTNVIVRYDGKNLIMLDREPKKEILLYSSTLHSSKCFKITVDDSGTITATEVTT